MKILFISPFFYPKIGGVEKHVYEISKRLKAKGHEISIITEKSLDYKDKLKRHYQSSSKSDSEARKPKKPVKSTLFEHENLDELQIYNLEFGKKDFFKKFRIWWKLFKLRDLIKEADLIHCHDVFFWYFPLKFLFFNKPVYTTFHGYETYPVRKKAIIIRKVTEFLSWGNICIGDFMKKWYMTKPTFVSYGGTDVKIKNQKSFPKGEQIVVEKIKNKKSALFIGRLDDQTGIETYVKAYEIIKKQVPDFKFTVIGDGIFRNKIPKDIRVLGFRESPEKLLEDYRFAFVSRYLSILEAMAEKRLVFAVYDNPIKEDYLKMAPYAKYINITNSEEELSKNILYFLDYPDEEKKLVNNAYNWVKDQNWDNVVNLYLKLWKVT